MKVAVVGAGHAGCAHAYKLAEAGHSVRLLKTSRAMHEESFEAVASAGGVHAIDDTAGGRNGFQPLEKITRDPETAVAGADAVLVLTQSLWHERVADLICPHINQARLIIVAPGYLGSIHLRRKLPDRPNVLYAEGESLPFDARLVAPGTVQILFKNVRNPLGIMPASRREDGLRIARELFDNYVLRESIVESALHNPNLVVHTVGTIMSAARIEYSAGEFWMYREAFTPSTWNVVNDLDAERLAVLASFGLPRQGFKEAFKLRTFEDQSVSPEAAFHNYAYFGSPKGPNAVNHRYVYEDVPMGLCLMGSLGDAVGVRTPIAGALVRIASSLLQTDFAARGRTLASLGLARMDADGLKRYFL